MGKKIREWGGAQGLNRTIYPGGQKPLSRITLRPGEALKEHEKNLGPSKVKKNSRKGKKMLMCGEKSVSWPANSARSPWAEKKKNERKERALVRRGRHLPVGEEAAGIDLKPKTRATGGVQPARPKRNLKGNSSFAPEKGGRKKYRSKRPKTVTGAQKNRKKKPKMSIPGDRQLARNPGARSAGASGHSGGWRQLGGKNRKN